MNVTIITRLQKCNQRERDFCGEKVTIDGEEFVQKYVFADEKMPKLFLTRADAEAEAKLLGYTVTE